MRYLSLALFALLLFVGLMLYWFPYDTAKERIVWELEKTLNKEISIKKIGLDLKKGSLCLNRVEVTHPGIDLRFEAEKIAIKIHPRPLLKKKIVLGLKACRGRIDGLKLMGYFLSDIDYDWIRGAIALTQEKAVINNLELMGKNIRVVACGVIYLEEDLGKSLLNLNLRVKPSSELMKDFGEVSDLLEELRDEEGYIPLSLQGRLSFPRIEINRE
jgi:hypothetical protein